MKIRIENTTDHKYIGNVIYYNGDIDNLFITDDIKIELIDAICNDNIIRLISTNYIIDGLILEE